VEAFWATAQESFAATEALVDGVLALPHPADATLAYDALVSAWEDSRDEARALLEEQSPEVLASFEFEGPDVFAEVAPAMSELGLEECADAL
jgi:hypothetical protein